MGKNIREIVIAGEKGTYPGTVRLHEDRLWVFATTEGNPSIFMFQPYKKAAKECPDTAKKAFDTLMERVQKRIEEYEAGENS